MCRSDIPPCMILIDKEGRWFHKGLEMIHREFIKLFYQNMKVDSRGRYVITLAGDQCYVDVEDTPFVVWRTAVTDDDKTGPRFSLHLSDDSREDLDPYTLMVGAGNVLYCRVRNGAFPARFSRPAYYQLAEHIEEEKSVFYLTLKGQRYAIKIEKGET